MYMMPMYFSFTPNNTFLFEDFTSNSGGTYFLWLLVFFFVNVGLQYLEFFRNRTHNNEIRQLLRE